MNTVLLLVVSGLALYVACGAAALALAVWTYPEYYDPDNVSQYERWDIQARRLFAFWLWPFSIADLCVERFSCAVLRSKRNSAQIRAELEKELAAARAEIDAFMKAAK